MDISDEKAFQERINLIISKLGNSVKLARSSGITPQAIRQYANGSTDPTRKKLIALAKAGNVSVEWLATGIGPEQPAPNTFNRELMIQTIAVLEGCLQKMRLELDQYRRGKVTIKLFESLDKMGIQADNVAAIEKETLELLELI